MTGNAEAGIVESAKPAISEAARPIIDWLTTNGLSLAGRVAAAAVILLVGVLIIKGLNAFMRRVIEKRISGRALLQHFIISVVIKSAWAMLFIVVLGKLGVEVGPLIAGLGVTGFILGFAFQESLGSLAAGIMLAFNQPFKIGDFVQLAGLEGTVMKLDMMAVTLATFDNRRVTIPNKQAWGAPIVNYSALELRRFEVIVGISYSADIAKAKAVALETLGNIEVVLKDPAPACEVKSLGDSAVILAVRGWTKNADYWTAFFDANQLIKESFDRQGVAIPFPQLDVHMIGSKGEG